MMWMVAIGCLLAGALIGAITYKLLKSDAIQVHRLEAELQLLREEHQHYKSEVHTHFSDSAELVNKLTRSYQEVYQHLAQGAQTLCPEHIAKQITTAAPALLMDIPDESNPKATYLSPPLDYANPKAIDEKPRSSGAS